MGQLASFISGPVTSCEMEDGYNKAVVLENDNTKKAFKDLVQHDCRGGDLCRMAEVGSLSARAKMAIKTFVRRVFINFFHDKAVVFARNCKVANSI